MSNDFTNFSLTVEGSREELVRLENLFDVMGKSVYLYSKKDFINTGLIDEDHPDIEFRMDQIEAMDSEYGELDVETELQTSHDGKDTYLWISSKNSPDLEGVAALLQDYLVNAKSSKAPEYITFSWSSDSTKMREDAFQGGAFFITKKRIEELNSIQWIKGQINNLEFERQIKENNSNDPDFVKMVESWNEAKSLNQKAEKMLYEANKLKYQIEERAREKGKNNLSP